MSATFAENLKAMPGVSHLAGLKLLDAAGEEVGFVPHASGQVGSLTLYNHLAQLYGAITPEAAERGLELYAEHVADAREQPGRHPNIDRLIGLIERGQTLRVKAVFAE